MEFTRRKKFIKQYQKLPIKLQSAFEQRFKLFLENSTHPLLHVHDLGGEYIDCQSFNVSADVRCIYRKVGENFIELVAIGSHSELYE